MTIATGGRGGRKAVRGLAATVALLLAAGGTALATHGDASTKVAVGRSVPDSSTTSSTDAPTTSTEPSTTVAPASSEPTTPRPTGTAPRPAAPRTTAAPKPAPAPPPPPPPSGFTAA